MEKKRFTWVMLPEGAVIVTKKERQALNAHQEKVRRETIEAIFDCVWELITGWIKFGGSIETLLTDFEKIRRKFIEREEEC